jgi:hypothetical protein
MGGMVEQWAGVVTGIDGSNAYEENWSGLVECRDL